MFCTNTTAVVDQVRSAVNATPSKLRSNSNSSSKIGSASPAARALLNPLQQLSPVTPGDDASCFTPVDGDLPVAINIPASKAPRQQATATTSAIRRQRAKMEDSLRSANNMSSPPAEWETEVATHVVIPNTTSSRPRKNATRTATVPACQITATGKRKRLSIDVAEESTEADIEYQAVLTKRRQLVRESDRPCTPTLPFQSDGLLTPTTLPALTPSSSVMSTPPVVKARAAGRKQRKIRTKRDFEQRVPQKKFDEIMAGRKSVVSATEGIAGGSTRSGRVRRA